MRWLVASVLVHMAAFYLPNTLAEGKVMNSNELSWCVYGLLMCRIVRPLYSVRLCFTVFFLPSFCATVSGSLCLAAPPSSRQCCYSRRRDTTAAKTVVDSASAAAVVDSAAASVSSFSSSSVSQRDCNAATVDNNIQLLLYLQ